MKLGTGGLLRAYTSSVTNALENTNKKELVNGYLVTIKFNYNKSREIDKLLNNCKIINKTFDDNITYEVEIDDKILTKLNKLDVDIKIKKNQLLII